MQYYFFGSENSKDYDVLVLVDSIHPNIDANSNLCKFYNLELSKLYPEKPLNCNIGILKDSKLIKVFKGTADELHNCIHYTYKNHKQYFENPFVFPIERNWNEKILRIARFILTFFSRVESLRPLIKSALRGNIIEKAKVLELIDFTKLIEFPSKKESKEDIYKVLAFQFGQLFVSLEGFECDSFTKTDIERHYPKLSNFLRRKPISFEDLEYLNSLLKRYLELLSEKLKDKNFPLIEKQN